MSASSSPIGSVATSAVPVRVQTRAISSGNFSSSARSICVLVRTDSATETRELDLVDHDRALPQLGTNSEPRRVARKPALASKSTATSTTSHGRSALVRARRGSGASGPHERVVAMRAARRQPEAGQDGISVNDSNIEPASAKIHRPGHRAEQLALDPFEREDRQVHDRDDQLAEQGGRRTSTTASRTTCSQLRPSRTSPARRLTFSI